MAPNVLSIAGFDPAGGAGVLADVKTFSALRCYGLAAITAITAQNTKGVAAIHVVPAEFVAAQIDTLFADVEIAAVKLGMLASPAIVKAVAQKLMEHGASCVMLDPVLAASSGDSLAIGDVAEAIVEHLAPLVTLVTPNLAEAACLAKAAVPTTAAGMHKLSEQLHGRGFKSVLIKGGHLQGATVDDVLFDGASHHTFSSARVVTRNTHGTGCTLSAAIAAELSLGLDLVRAIEAAKDYVCTALAGADDLEVGRGPGPLHHFHRFW
jgi:hydroxymethylpyrimidine/phosphomethylpyrimidine kinase